MPVAQEAETEVRRSEHFFFAIAAAGEARLVRSGRVPGLRPVARAGHWRVWSVAGARLAAGPAIVTALGPDEVRLAVRRPGEVLVKVRFSPYWAIADGRGCVEEGAGGFTRVRAAAAGPLRLVMRFSPERIVARGPRCTD